MKLPTEHRKTEKKDGEKRFKKKTPGDLGPGETTVHTREGGPAVQLCRDSNVACKWNNGEFAQRSKHKDTIGKIQRILHPRWKSGAATPISNIDNFMKHIYREHNQEADHWADIGAQGRRKNDIFRKNVPTTWKAIRGLWVGSFKDDGRSGCGIVIKGVDRQKWVTICKIAVPLKVGAAMAAEVLGVCVLTSVLDLILCKSLSVQNINQRINRILHC